MRKLSIDELAKFDINTRFNHPTYELKNIFELIGRIGAKEFLKSPKCDSERDMLISCMFAFASRMLEGREWFIRRGDNPPDMEMVAGGTKRELKDKPVDFVQVEIVQIPVSFSSSEEGYNMIKRKKLTNYLLGSDNILLIFINNHNAPIWAEELRERFTEYKGVFSQIWVIYLLKVDPNESFVYSVRCISQTGDILTLSLKEEFSRGLMYNDSIIERLGVKIV